MIDVKVKTNPDGFMEIKVEGHARSNVCASVSTLLQSQVRFLQELAQHYPQDLKVEVTKHDLS